MDDAKWQPHVPGFLTAAGCNPDAILQAATLALMLSPHGETAVVAVDAGDNRTAWCRAYSSGLSCVALAPRGDRFEDASVPRDVFFAKGDKWPPTWLTPTADRLALRRKTHVVPWTVDGMAWCNHPDGRVHTALVVGVDPLMLQLQPGMAPEPADGTDREWRAVAYNVAGWHQEWLEGRYHVHNFRLGAMRAGLRVKYAENPAKPRRGPETAEERKARYARWSAACQEGRRKAAAKRAAGLEAAKEAVRQNVQKGA
jgi:hypothetical protein